MSVLRRERRLLKDWTLKLRSKTASPGEMSGKAPFFRRKIWTVVEDAGEEGGLEEGSVM